MNQMKNDFNFLLNGKVLGFYTHYEMIQVFGIDPNGKIFNIYTLITLQDKGFNSVDKEFITSPLRKITNKYKWGMLKVIKPISEIDNFWTQLVDHSKFIIDKVNCNMGNLKFFQKNYIRPDGPQLNFILKNNFYCGSYVIEGFDLDKLSVGFLLEDANCLNALSEDINSYVPINLANVSDRLGNVIFQFPINSIKLKIDFYRTKIAKLDFVFHDDLIQSNLNIEVIATNSFDECVMDLSISDIKGSQSINLDSSEIINLIIYERNNKIVLFQNKNLTFIESINTNIMVLSPQPRCFYIGSDLKKQSVSNPMLSNVRNDEVESNIRADKRHLINNRKYSREQKQLEAKKEFIQYFGNEGDRQKALTDLRALISQCGQQSVYLWDPYLSAIDIKETLYYCPYLPSSLKAITGLKQHNSKEQAIKDMRTEFEKDDKIFLNIRLEVRGRIGGFGYDFHDRFLIFPGESIDSQAKVWSLGISVNQLGKSHHIVQKVNNPQHIVNAFNQLWDKLGGDKCLVWKTIKE